MAEIDQELLTFKEKVEPSLGAMESTISQITPGGEEYGN